MSHWLTALALAQTCVVARSRHACALSCSRAFARRPLNIAQPERCRRCAEALVVFTSGCFGHKEYVLQLLVAAERALRMLPVIMDDDFAVPSKEGLAISLRSWDCVPDQVDKATRTGSGGRPDRLDALCSGRVQSSSTSAERSDRVGVGTT